MVICWFHHRWIHQCDYGQCILNKGEVLNLRHTQGVKDIRWSVDGCTLFSGGLDCYVNVIDTEKGVCSHSYKHTE